MDCTPISCAGITTYTNVMYNFQQHTLEAYYSASGGISTTFKWQYSTTTNDIDFIDISSATNSAFYTVPANFASSYLSGSIHSTTLYFRCLLSNPAITPVKTANQDIIFINTTTSGYGTGASGVKYLTLQKGEVGTVAAGTLNIALTNLDDDTNTDAKNLGDFYQWGRATDGHQKTAWSKNASHANQILPFDGVATSDTVTRNASAAYDGNQQTITTANDYNKKFLNIVHDT
jgi:hypothetical protein